MIIFGHIQTFPKEEMYSLVDQMRRSSRAVSSAVAEAWRRRRYYGAFVSKLNEAEAESAETQVWIDYSVRCLYLNAAEGKELHDSYDSIIGKLVVMINNPNPWLLVKHHPES